MGSFSVWYWLIVFGGSFLFLIPAWRIVSKAGYPGVWSLLALIPLVNLAMLWVFAFTRWPTERSRT